MPERNSRAIRAAYLAALIQGLGVTWPVLSGLLLFKAGVGAIVGVIEGWGVWQGVYFAYVTGLTIGYGDLAPQQALTRFLAIVIGFSGVLLTGLVAALAVKAMQAAPRPSPDNA
jgi:Ion channel